MESVETSEEASIVSLPAVVFKDVVGMDLIVGSSWNLPRATEPSFPLQFLQIENEIWIVHVVNIKRPPDCLCLRSRGRDCPSA
jgi:hypothetical protein